jgi:hypothetical protein
MQNSGGDYAKDSRSKEGMAQQSARRGRKNQMYSSCLEHAQVSLPVQLGIDIPLPEVPELVHLAEYELPHVCRQDLDTLDTVNLCCCKRPVPINVTAPFKLFHRDHNFSLEPTPRHSTYGSSPNRRSDKSW